MEITEIIKNGFIFPSEDFTQLAIYTFITIISALCVFVGLVLNDNSYLLIRTVLIIIGIIIELIIQGYRISIIKSGIDFTNAAPRFNIKENIINGIKNIIITIVYLIIPSIIVFAIAYLTNALNDMQGILNAITTNTNINFSSSGIAITIILGIVIFLIFSFILTTAQARLAKKNSLSSALNVIEAFRDIRRIGWFKLIAIILLVAIITLITNGIITFFATYSHFVQFISLFVTPYLTFFASRSVGLMYRDIK